MAEEAKKTEVKAIETTTVLVEESPLVKAVTASDVSKDKDVISDAVVVDVIATKEPAPSLEEKPEAKEKDLPKNIEETVVAEESPKTVEAVAVVSTDAIAPIEESALPEPTAEESAKPEPTVEVAAEIVVVADVQTASSSVAIDETPAVALATVPVEEEPVVA